MTEDKIHATELVVDTMTVEKVEAKAGVNIATGGGTMVEGVIQTEGGKFVNRDAIENTSGPSQVVSFNNADNALLWSKLNDIVGIQANLVTGLDDLPNRVGKLEVFYEPATSFEKLIIRLLVSVAAAIVISIGVAGWVWQKSHQRRGWFH